MIARCNALIEKVPPFRASATTTSDEQLTVRVSVRLRPTLRSLDGPQANELPKLVLDEVGNAVQIPGDAESLRAPKAYKFHSVFGPAASATDIYSEVLTTPVDNLLEDGYNVAIFAYGQTGSGKTFTMAGSEDGSSAGIAAMVFRHIFGARGSETEDGLVAEDPGKNSTVQAGGADSSGGSPAEPPAISLSIMEIYNEVVYDLLNARAKVEMKTAKGPCGDGTSSAGLRFVNLLEYPVRTVEQAQRLMRRGMEGKTMGPNYQHDHSSRSHTVVRLVVKDRLDNVGRADKQRGASLMLVDLAGSEAAHDNSSALATSEGKAIGKSLFQLRQCVHALSAGKRPDYRVSKLTRLLEPALTRGYVSVICTTGIGVTNFRQVADTLEFGMQAQVVQLNPDSEWDSVKAKAEIDKLREALRKATEENADLRQQVHRGGGGTQLQEAIKLKDMMEAQLLSLMTTAGSAEVALREERQLRQQAESALQTLQSQHETAVFALHERESGELTEKMLQKQEQLRVHVKELETALRQREDDERARERAMHAIQRQNETLHHELQHASAALAELRTRVGREDTSWRDGHSPTQGMQAVTSSTLADGFLDGTGGVTGVGSVGDSSVAPRVPHMSVQSQRLQVGAVQSPPAALGISTVQSELDAVRQTLYGNNQTPPAPNPAPAPAQAQASRTVYVSRYADDSGAGVHEPLSNEAWREGLPVSALDAVAADARGGRPLSFAQFTTGGHDAPSAYAGPPDSTQLQARLSSLVPPPVEQQQSIGTSNDGTPRASGFLDLSAVENVISRLEAQLRAKVK
eukprot:SAG31_NODE_2683_length_5256_cov_6.529184_2_plen_801_part_00